MKISKVLIAYDGSKCADEAIEDLRRAGLPERAYVIVMAVIEDWLCELLSVEHLELLAQRASARINSLMPGWLVEPCHYPNLLRFALSALRPERAVDISRW
jgi:nucleotide-binding universal stress UspA family protein